VEPFIIDVPASELADLRDRLRRTRWPEPATVGDWSQGAPLAAVQALCRYWAQDYDWPARQTYLNSFPQFRTTIDGLAVHFLHVRSPHEGALPLVLTHGWPGSFVEFLEAIGPLTDPAAHGGDPADAFDVVVPSLPGYGFSDKPSAPGWGIRRIAVAWAELMARLGCRRYGAQGGDWGSAVTLALAQQDAEHLAGVHVNLLRVSPARGSELTGEEQAALDATTHYDTNESGYLHIQSTRPQTLGYGLVDSPAAQCAWILEKFWAWTDTDGDPVGALGADRILDNIMLYWIPAAATSSSRLYWESVRDLRTGGVTVPLGVSVFPKEIFRPSRRFAERHFPDIRYWGTPPAGGHFAAFEQPALFVEEVRRFFRTVR
jgi:pimeloyl-ACP methyl ester carboxylesterase